MCFNNFFFVFSYDVCSSSFSKGVYIFEDTFDNWQNTSFQSNLMKSAAWKAISEGSPKPYCGSVSGTESLLFGGVNKRFIYSICNSIFSYSNVIAVVAVECRSAETTDLDLTFGGWIEAEMFIPPIGYDVTNLFCRTGYIGVINLDYSIDGRSLS